VDFTWNLILETFFKNLSRNFRLVTIGTKPSNAHEYQSALYFCPPH
jgi:hypothetical protein